MQYFIIITLILGLLSALAAITAQLKEKNSSKEEKAVQHRIHRPVFSSVFSNAVDEREKMVDYLLKRKHLTLDEMQFIYNFLMETGKEKWRYIEGYWGYYRISTTGMVESCRRKNYLDPSLYNGRYQVFLCIAGEKKGVSIHKVVAQTFIPNPDGAISVVPKDGDYRHCDVRNLMWKPQAITTKTAIKIAMKEAA